MIEIYTYRLGKYPGSSTWRLEWTQRQLQIVLLCGTKPPDTLPVQPYVTPMQDTQDTTTLKRVSHGQKCLHWFSYPAQLGPISSSTGPNIQLKWAQYPAQLGPIPNSTGPNTQLKWAQYPAQMGPISSSNGPNIQLKWAQYPALGDALFRQLTQQNWPQDWKLAQSCWCLH